MNPMMVQAMASQMAQMGLPPMSMGQIQNLLLHQMMQQKMPQQPGMFMGDYKVRGGAGTSGGVRDQDVGSLARGGVWFRGGWSETKACSIRAHFPCVASLCVRI